MPANAAAAARPSPPSFATPVRPRDAARSIQAPKRSSCEPAAGSSHSSSGRTAQTIVSEPRSATLAWNSVCIGAISRVARRPTPTPYATRATRPFGVVLGSVIMKNMKTSTSGEVTRIHQK